MIDGQTTCRARLGIDRGLPRVTPPPILAETSPVDTTFLRVPEVQARGGRAPCLEVEVASPLDAEGTDDARDPHTIPGGSRRLTLPGHVCGIPLHGPHCVACQSLRTKSPGVQPAPVSSQFTHPCLAITTRSVNPLGLEHPRVGVDRAPGTRRIAASQKRTVQAVEHLLRARCSRVMVGNMVFVIMT